MGRLVKRQVQDGWKPVGLGRWRLAVTFAGVDSRVSLAEKRIVVGKW